MAPSSCATGGKLKEIDILSLGLQEIRVQVEAGWLMWTIDCLKEFMSIDSETVRQRIEYQAPSPALVTGQSDQAVFFHLLYLHPIRISITFVSDGSYQNADGSGSVRTDPLPWSLPVEGGRLPCTSRCAD